VDVLWLLVPLLGAAVAHAPVLRLDLLRTWKRPIDGGRTLGGKRLFGDNKTWRGAFAMAGGVVLATLVLSRFPGYVSRLPAELRGAHPLLLGLALGVGMVVGELPNSFLKRRLGVEPGARARSGLGIVLSILDQGDYVIGIWVCLAPLWIMPPAKVAVAFVAVVAVHAVVNVLLYVIGARRSLT
jgi:CDP-2,3-bis-(O-geranylgeranyl)-sn-glycerol synthase